MSIPSSPNIYGSSSIPLTSEDYAKFSRIFNNCNPQDGDLDGEAARDLLMRSKLPIEVLGQIWNLADTRNRGRLDQAEFIIAMYFVQHFMNGNIKSMPSHLPPELLNAAKGVQMGSPNLENSGLRSRSGTFTGTTPNPGVTRTASTHLRGGYSSVRWPNTERVEVNSRSRSLNNSPFIPPNSAEEEWAIKPAEKSKFDRFFSTIDVGQKGYITGEEAVQYFLRSKLPEATLAQIWDLADISQNGQLNREEFAVSMYLIQLKLSGGELPQVLPRSLIPLSMRTPLGGFAPNGPRSPPLPVQPTSLLDFNDDNLELISSPPMQSRPAKSGDTKQSTAGVPTTPAADTAEVLNLQSQIARTTTANNESKQQRAQLESNLANVTSQKNELLAKFTQIKAQHDADLQAVQELQNSLKQENDELENIRNEFAKVEGELNQLQIQKNMLQDSMEKDRLESIDIKQKVKQLNEEIQALRVENEQLNKENKQQKNLLLVNRGQLASVSSEKQKVENEIEDNKKQLAEVNEELASPDLKSVSEPKPELAPISMFNAESNNLDKNQSTTESPSAVNENVWKSPNFNIPAGPVPGKPVERNFSSSSFDDAFPAVDLANIDEDPFAPGFGDSFSSPNVLTKSPPQPTSQPPVSSFDDSPYWAPTEFMVNPPASSDSTNVAETPLANADSTNIPEDPFQNEAASEEKSSPEMTLHEQGDQERAFVSTEITEEPESDLEEKALPVPPQEEPSPVETPALHNEEKEVEPLNTLAETDAGDLKEKKVEPLDTLAETDASDLKGKKAETSAVQFSEDTEKKNEHIDDDFDAIFDDDFVDLKAKRASGLNGGLAEFDAAFDTDFDVDFDTSFDTSKTKSAFDDFGFNTEFPSTEKIPEGGKQSLSAQPSKSNMNHETSGFTGFGFEDFKPDESNIATNNDLDEVFGGKVDLNKTSNDGFDDIFGDAFSPSVAPANHPVANSVFDTPSSSNQPQAPPPFDPFETPIAAPFNEPPKPEPRVPSKPAKGKPITEDDLYASNLEELMGMGFTQDQAVDALERYDNDLNKATNFLLDQ
ncbi:hypothetical protein K7432_006316 [Basidiobolus ranarum]|uniref:Uncharacterized protein n=1 Tax=Basidiobolus ranarum TaxID=34480 RepID=A0ABR2W280_9FUNG